jgi:hypothetical protein
MFESEDLGYDAPVQGPDNATPIILPLAILAIVAEIAWHLCQQWGWFQ